MEPVELIIVMCVLSLALGVGAYVSQKMNWGSVFGTTTRAPAAYDWTITSTPTAYYTNTPYPTATPKPTTTPKFTSSPSKDPKLQ